MNKVSQQTLEDQLKLIKKGAIEVIGEQDLKSKLEKTSVTGNPLIIKLGLDPTAPDIHLGHTVVLRKIRQFQDMGHKAFLIIGDFTGRIGDPTGKDKGRPQLSESQVLENADTYRRQLNKILDPLKTVICFNSEWLEDVKPSRLIELLSKQTVARILERDSFSTRLQSGQPIGMHELLYPILQGFDSLAIDADVEIGGSDQTFNILMGRDMQGREGKDKQVALFMPLLEGINDREKMSKSLGNSIGIDEPANLMFEKVMQIGDEQIVSYFELVTDLSVEVVEGYRHQLLGGQTNPKNIKMRLAWEVVMLYHGSEAASEAKEHFVNVFAKGSLPKEMPTFDWLSNDTIMSFLVNNKMMSSKSEVRRLVKQKGIRINDVVILEPEVMGLKSGDVIRIGKKRFIRVA